MMPGENKPEAKSPQDKKPKCRFRYPKGIIELTIHFEGLEIFLSQDNKHKQIHDLDELFGEIRRIYEDRPIFLLGQEKTA